MLSPGRRAQLTAALLGAFQNSIDDLRELASYYEAEGLAANLPGANASVKAVIRAVVDVSCDCGEAIVESVARSARRRRPHNQALATVVGETWPFADGLDHECVDELIRQVHAAGLSLEQLRQATQSVLGAVRPPLWDAHGSEPSEDLIEGLAQLRGRPLKLALVARRLGGAHGLPEGIARWLQRVAPDLVDPVPEVGSAGAASCDHVAAAPNDVRLYDRLSRLPDTVFEQIVFYARIDRSLIAPPSAPLATRMLDVAKLAAVDQDLCRRLAAELDQRAPWTR
ncbi:MAG TPA: effector-associated domain EAD1-containing protein [Kofleriaceae bacterium]